MYVCIYANTYIYTHTLLFIMAWRCLIFIAIIANECCQNTFTHPITQLYKLNVAILLPVTCVTFLRGCHSLISGK